MASGGFDLFVGRLEAMGCKDRMVAICYSHGVDLTEVFHEDRRMSVMMARRACWAFMRSEMGKSYSEIGEIFNRDHTTVLNALKRDTRFKPSDAAVSSNQSVALKVEGEKATTKERERVLTILRVHRRIALSGLTEHERAIVTNTIDGMIEDVQKGE